MKKILALALSLSFLFPLAAQEPSSDTGEPEDGQRTIDVEEARRAILEEDPAELTNLKIGDTDVSLEIHGFWNPGLSLTWGITNSPFGLGVASVGSPFLFEQEVDLTLALWIRERWFVEANFQDDNPLNTYRAGYQGADGAFVEYAGIGNTGLDFPIFPYLDMGGSTKSSFGFYGRFSLNSPSSGPVKMHTLVRYDAAVVEESVFSGGHERNYTYTALDSFLQGRYFRLPDTNIGTPPIVYLEDDDGWHEAKPSEASASAFLGVVELAATPKGRVAVYYPGGYDKANSFFNDVKAVFAPVDLDGYAPKGKFEQDSYTATVMGKEALILYEKGFFSPFEEQNRYKSPVSNAEDAAVAVSSTGTGAAGFDLVEDEGVSGAEDVYRLVKSGASDDRWPLAETDASYKLMYLGNKSSVSENLRIRWTSLAAVSGYSIGENVLPGSIAVFRGGMRDMNFSFNTATGEVTLGSPAQANETIRITYLRESSEKRFGSIAAGLGFVYETENPFSWRFGLGLRWNTAEDAFSEYGQSNAGRVGAGAQLGWQGETVKAAVTLGAGYEENDTTGLYRAAGMEGNELTWMLPEGAGGTTEGAFQAHPPLAQTPLTRDNRADLVYRQYRSTNAVGIETLDDISRDHPIESESGISGPYTANDKALSSNVLVAEAVLDAAKPWAGYQVPLGSMKEVIAEARSIEIPFHLYGFDPNTMADFTVTAEFGPMPIENSFTGENPALIVSEDIYTPSTGLSNNCAIAEFLLTNEDRRKLQGATHFRLVIKRTGTGTVEGRVLIAPLIIRGVKFTPIVRDSSDSDFDTGSFDTVTTVETVDSRLRQRYASEIDRLHPQNAAQRVLKVGWDGLVSGKKAGADGLVPRLPLENYRSLTFFLKAPSSGSGNFVFQAGSGRERFDDYTLRAVIPLSALTPDVWQKVVVYYGKGKRELYVDGNIISGGDVQYHEDERQETFTYIAFYTDTDTASGSFSLDEICLEESIPGFWGNAGTTFIWEHRKPLLSVGDYAVIETPRFETNIESGARGAASAETEENALTEGAFVSRSRAEITVFQTNLGGHFNYGAASDTNPVWSGGHSVARNFGPLSVRESFSLDPEDSYWEHNAALSIGGRTLPFSFDTRAQQERTRLRRSWNTGFGVHGGTLLSLQTNLSALWVYPTPDNAETENYGHAWAESWREMKPDAGTDAQERTLKGNLTTSFGGEAVGVVFAFTPSQTERKLTDNANSATTTSLSFPWTAGTYSGNVIFARSWNSAILGAANDAGGDIIHYGESLERGSSHLLSPPIYSLFAEETAVMPQESFLLSETFSDSSDFLFTLPRRDDIASLFIPRSFETKLERTVGRRYDTLTDVFDLNVLTHFTADNFFGAYGKIPVLRFYQSDELNTLVSYHLKLPKQEDPSWDVTLDQDLWFFGFYGSSLSLGDTITVGSAGNIYAFTLTWTVVQQNNLPGKIYAALIDRFAENTLSPSLAFFANSSRVFQRVEKLKYTYNATGLEPVVTVSIGHESVVRISGHLNFSLFASLDISDNQNTRTTSVIASAGTKLRLSF